MALVPTSGSPLLPRRAYHHVRGQPLRIAHQQYPSRDVHPAAVFDSDADVDSDYSAHSFGLTKFTPPDTPPHTPKKRRTSGRFYLEDKARNEDPSVLRWKIESKSFLVCFLALCATSAFTVWRLSPVISSGAAIMNSSASAIDSGARLTHTAGSIMYDVSSVATGVFFASGRAWCQLVGLGCVTTIPSAVAFETTRRPNADSEEHRKNTHGSLLEGAVVVNSLKEMKRLGENSSILHEYVTCSLKTKY